MEVWAWGVGEFLRKEQAKWLRLNWGGPLHISFGRRVCATRRFPHSACWCPCMVCQAVKAGKALLVVHHFWHLSTAALLQKQEQAQHTKQDPDKHLVERSSLTVVVHQRRTRHSRQSRLRPKEHTY